MQTEGKTGEKIFYLTVLNVLSAWCVVMLHCNGIFWTRPEGRLWITSNFIETACYFAVPIFFMISGITLLDYPKKYSTREYFIKRIRKAVIPFLVWSIIAFLDSVRSTIHDGGVPDLDIRHVIDNILNCRYILGVYWFFSALFAIYLSIPILAQIKNKEKILLYAVFVGMVFVSILPLVSNLIGIGYNAGYTPNIVNGYILYVMLGYLIAKRQFTRRQQICSYLLGILGWAMQFFGTLLLSEAGSIDQTFKGYLNLPVLLQAFAVFVFVKYHVPKNSFVVNFVNWLGKRTFGVYLIHGYLVRYLPMYLKIDTGSIVWRTAGACCVFLISAGIIWLLQKIPIIKIIVP